MFEAAPIYQLHPNANRIEREIREKATIKLLQPSLNERCN